MSNSNNDSRWSWQTIALAMVIFSSISIMYITIVYVNSESFKQTKKFINKLDSSIAQVKPRTVRNFNKV